MTAIITKNDIISAIAYWGIRQSPYLVPENLVDALRAVGKRIDEKKIFKTKKKTVIVSYEEIEQSAIKTLINDLIWNTPEIKIWNLTKTEQAQGITNPHDNRRAIKYAGTSRRGLMQLEDNDFIDLDALIQNVCKMIFNYSHIRQLLIPKHATKNKK